MKAVANAYWQGTDCECYAFAHKALDNVPTVDVAPVVRCKDCFLYGECQAAKFYGDHGYCSCGERKNDDD